MKSIPYKGAFGVEIKASQGKGRGVFATRRFRAEEVIESAPILKVPKADVSALGATFLGNYLFMSDNHKNVVLGLGITSMINHDDDANAEFYIVGDMITIKAKRAIPIGVEITINYRWKNEDWS